MWLSQAPVGTLSRGRRTPDENGVSNFCPPAHPLKAAVSPVASTARRDSCAAPSLLIPKVIRQSRKN